MGSVTYLCLVLQSQCQCLYRHGNSIHWIKLCMSSSDFSVSFWDSSVIFNSKWERKNKKQKVPPNASISLGSLITIFFFLETLLRKGKVKSPYTKWVEKSIYFKMLSRWRVWIMKQFETLPGVQGKSDKNGNFPLVSWLPLSVPPKIHLAQNSRNRHQ